MKCTNCGADVMDGSAFCTSCGTPVSAPTAPAGNEDRTVLVSQDLNNPFGQPAAAPQQFAQPTQFTSQPQSMPNNQFAQPTQPSQFTGQPQGMPNNQFAQPAQPSQFTGQPQGMPNNQFAQPAQPSQFTGQPQGMYGQPNQFGGQPQGMYGQPNMYSQQAPKPPRKPLSPKAKRNILIGAILVAVAVVFFVIILPILTRSKLGGKYTTSNSSYYHSVVFDNGTYVFYDDDGEISEVGTYEIDEDEIELTSIEGYDKEGKFNAEENKVGINGNFYKIKDKKATLDFKMTDDYLDTLEAKIEDATDKVLEDEEVYEEATWYSYYIYDDALLNPDTLYEEALAKELDYANDKTLKALIEGNYLEIDVYIYDYDDINIYFYCY